MSLFTTLQNIVPQQALSEFAGKLASSENPIVKRFFYSWFFYRLWYKT